MSIGERTKERRVEVERENTKFEYQVNITLDRRQTVKDNPIFLFSVSLWMEEGRGLTIDSQNFYFSITIKT